MRGSADGITGITIVKNAVSLGYPFLYAVKSVIPACDRFIISDGYSTDGTDEIIKHLTDDYPRKISVIKKKWGKSTSGEVLAEVTDDALSYCQTKWIYYIQADEIVHEANLELINTIPVNFSNYHSVMFSFIHFRPTIHYVLRNPSYRSAIRMFQNFGSSTRPLLMNVVLRAFQNIPDFAPKRYVRSGLDRLFSRSSIHSRDDGWSFSGNIYPILNLSDLRLARPIFHVGYVCKKKDIVIKRIESHARSIYSGMKAYEQSYKEAVKWDGTAETYWDEVIPYKSEEYPKILLEWIADDTS